jgi:hypothetical protein
MGSIVSGRIGPITSSDGSQTDPFRQGKSGETIVSELHGKFYEQNYRGNLYWATMATGVIFPAPAATANNPITLYNPFNSGKNLSLLSFDMVFTVIPGTPLTGLYGLYVNSNPAAAAVTGTVLTPQSGLVGSQGVPVGKPLTTSTVPAVPTLIKVFGQKVTGQVAAAEPNAPNQVFHCDFDGDLILTPGTSITPQQTVADTSNATVICTFVWEEVPV